MTKANKLQDQLEDLFSDVVLPEPETPPDATLETAEEEVKQAIAPEEIGPALMQQEPEPETQLPEPVFESVAVEAETPEPAVVAPPVLQPTAPEKSDLGFIARLARRIGKYWRSKLGRMLILAFLVVAITPALIISTVNFASQRSRIQENVTSNLELLATLHQDQIEQWIQSESTDLASLVHEPTLQRQIRNLLVTEQSKDEEQTTRLSIKSRLQNYTVLHPEFEEVFLLDTDGRVIISTDTAHKDELEDDQPYFVQGREQSYYGPPTFFERWNGLRMVFAEPLRYITGETIGVMVGLVQLEPLTQLIEIAPGPGETGETYLVTKDGFLVTSLRDKETPAPGEPLTPSPGIQKALAGESGRGAYDNYAGRSVLSAYRWLPEARMGLLSEQETKEANSVPLAERLSIPAVASLSVALTLLLSWQIARRVTEPIEKITESARRMVAGDLDQAVAVDREDEIGTLGRAFNHMASQLRQTVTGLEQELIERTTMLQDANYQFQKRAIQLEASAKVSRAAVSILNPQELMQTTVDLIRTRFNFYHVSIFLLDETSEWAVVRASTGAVGRQMMAQPHRLAVGRESMVGWVCAHRAPRIALDVGADAVHFDHPLLPYTRSEMVLPLQASNRLLGALDVQSTEEAAFDDDDVRTLQGMADLIAIALEHARLFEETQQGARHQQLITRVADRFQRADNIDDILTRTLEDLGKTFDLAQATVYLGAKAKSPSDDGGPDHPLSSSPDAE